MTSRRHPEGFSPKDPKRNGFFACALNDGELRIMNKLKNKDFISVADLTEEEIFTILDLTKKLKDDHKKGMAQPLLQGKILAMIFQKPSTRTRVSFESGIAQLGGQGLFLSSADLQLGRGETVADTAKVLSRYVDGIMARTFKHQDVLDLAQHGTVPVINGLTDFNHPCQAMADIFTIYEKKKKFKGLKLVYVGDGNNVAHSLLDACSLIGMDIVIATPNGYEPLNEVVELAQKTASKKGSEVLLMNDAREAVRGADVIYTDVWASMGQEAEHTKRVQVFKSYQLNSSLLKGAKQDHLVMHCLPAHRGEEITDEVVDGPNSVVFDQAENRLHVQKAIMALLMS